MQLLSYEDIRLFWVAARAMYMVARMSRVGTMAIFVQLLWVFLL